MAYQVETYDSKWNEIRTEDGGLLYWANKRARQIYRIDPGFVNGPIHKFLGNNVTSQFSKEEIDFF